MLSTRAKPDQRGAATADPHWTRRRRRWKRRGKTLSDSYNAQTALLDATVNTAAEEIALLTRLNDTLAVSDGSVNGLIAAQLTSLDDLVKPCSTMA